MLIDLVLTVCMAGNPASCKEERLTFESRGSQAQCMMLSSPYVAAWSGDHPDWKVKSWRCAWPEERKQGI
ncbi:hypothetical protein [Aurantimonas sp. Leaf443]|uniref:hypothetical protein n=1 Tax=Aurantimonas sp. Leaf443 TaxID=1736378 RepID=UPI0006FBE5E8|nr:hypothetical protein [Aurantimonas sp. Leaf443]KQT85217.1 hypothetical protein ASG48_08105 [Aurantimonas sp. Leaf443]